MEVLIGIIALIFGVLQIVLFFKLWGMTNDVADMKKMLAHIANNQGGTYQAPTPDVQPTEQVVKTSPSTQEKPSVIINENPLRNTRWEYIGGGLFKSKIYQYALNADGLHYTKTCKCEGELLEKEEGTYSFDRKIVFTPNNKSSYVFEINNTNDAIYAESNLTVIYKKLKN